MAAPMSIASTPDLVAARCRAGVLGCFPTHNAWKDAGLTHWLGLIGSSRQRHSDITGSAAAPFAVNINVSRAKPAELLARELDLCRRHDVQIVTTNVGDPSDVVARVHEWGGMLVEADLADIVWTDAVCGVSGNFLRPSLLEHGLAPDCLPPLDAAGRPTIPREVKPWRIIFSGGHSVAGIAAVPSVGDEIFVRQPHNGVVIDPFGGAQEASSPMVVLDMLGRHGVTATEQVARIRADPVGDRPQMRTVYREGA